MKPLYTGNAFPIEDIIRMLRQQGLDIEDEEAAIHTLHNISYSRFKAYLVPLMADRSTHKFRPGATFGQAYAYYGFDRRLRELVFHELEKVEISIRTHIAYAVNGTENGYWFTNPDHFRNASSHRYLLKGIKREVERSDVDAIRSFRAKYSNEFPPSWLTLEATSMGTLSMIYDEMKDGPIKDRMASYYGVDARTFASWIRHIVYIRNICAHHGRLWNHTLTVRARIPEKPRNRFPKVKESMTANVYYTLCVIQYLQNTVKPANTFAARLKSLIDNFPLIGTKELASMGFPADWERDEFWGFYRK
ncbi:MAG: Abi family protein [Bacteroidales bacterium]|nr:Abi family protein [Bacteroidales bacterium]